MEQFTVLLLPGLGNSGGDHWQTYWERDYGYERVVQDDWDTPRMHDWVARLHTRITQDDVPKILVAHSLACCLVAHWAGLHDGPVAAALLVAPSDVEGSNYSPGTVGFAPMPLPTLPFPSMVVASSDDEYVPLNRGRYFAHSWGSDYRLLGPRGHIGSAARLEAWHEGKALLKELIKSISR